MTQKNIAVGIDIGGTNTTWGFVDEGGGILVGGSFPTFADEPPEKLAARIAAAVKADWLSIEQDDMALLGIGMGAPNANYHRGTIEYPPNFDWEVVEFVKLIRQHIDLPVVMTNDANAAAIGEMTFGDAVGVDDFIVITLGTGLGSGIVSGGRLVLGHDGFAGEMGHITAQRDSDRLCGCGRTGCLETFASATGIVTTARELLSLRSDDSTLRLAAGDGLTAADVGKAAARGDALALEAFEITGRMLGRSLADAVAILSPQVVFLFGGLANAGELITAPVKRHMEDNLLPIFRNKVDVRISGLQQKNAAILGAAALNTRERIRNPADV